MIAKASALAALAAGCLLETSIALGQADPAPAPTPTPTAVPTPAPTRSTASKGFASAKSTVDRNRSLDAAFMARTALVALQEVELGRIAAERSSNDDVRSLGRQMADDCSKANDALRQLALNAGLDLPTALDAGRRSEVDRLSRLSAQALDTAYVTALLGKHDAEVEAFRAQMKVGQEVELLAWVNTMLPLLETQQERIHEVASGLNIPVK